MKRIIVDLDGTLTEDVPGVSYADKKPNLELAEKIREYHANGFEIVIHTARNMRTFQGNIGKINANTLPIIITWLALHDIPYNEIFVGKPWCGDDGFYVDDKAIRPSEFISMPYEEIAKLINPRLDIQ